LLLNIDGRGRITCGLELSRSQFPCSLSSVPLVVGNTLNIFKDKIFCFYNFLSFNIETGPFSQMCNTEAFQPEFSPMQQEDTGRRRNLFNQVTE